jgi:3-oxoacyl-[acyl-carrier-protein] synthase-1
MAEPSPRRAREVVVTGTGVACLMGDDWPAIETALREGRSTPFLRWPPAVEHGMQCQVIGLYPGELSPDRLGIDKSQARFMSRVALLALRAARIAVAESGVATRDAAVVVGSGTGDVGTHREIAARLARTEGSRRVAPTVIPRLMASTVSANLATVLGSTGPSFSATAACAGGAYNLLLASQLVEHGHVDVAIAGGADVADIHFHAGFDAMRAYTTVDNDRPERASRPYAADRAGFVFSEGAGVVVLETRQHAEARGAAILGVLLGYGMSSDGTGDMVAPSPEGAELAMRRALDHAGIAPDDAARRHLRGASAPEGARWAPRRLLLDEGLHRSPGLRRRGDRGDLHAGDAPRRLDRAVCERGAARPGASRLPAGPAPRVAAAAHGAQQLVRLRRHERGARARAPLTLARAHKR